jgi:predicted transcriptional regulator
MSVHDVTMRTVIDVPEAVIQSLDELGSRERCSRAALIREAISVYLEQKKLPPPQDAFGLWAEDATDGVDYQKAIRDEWSGRG